MTSDATPNTPVDPRHDEYVATVIRQAIDQWRIQNDPADPHGVSLHEFIRATLADAGLLALPDEGSLRSQASGTPTAWEVAEAMHATDTPKPLADAHPAVQTALVRRAQAAIDHITGATS